MQDVQMGDVSMQFSSTDGKYSSTMTSTSQQELVSREEQRRTLSEESYNTRMMEGTTGEYSSLGRDGSLSPTNTIITSSTKKTKERAVRGGALDTIPDEYLYPQGIKADVSESATELEQRLGRESTPVATGEYVLKKVLRNGKLETISIPVIRTRAEIASMMTSSSSKSTEAYMTSSSSTSESKTKMVTGTFINDGSGGRFVPGRFIDESTGERRFVPGDGAGIDSGVKGTAPGDGISGTGPGGRLVPWTFVDDGGGGRFVPGDAQGSPTGTSGYGPPIQAQPDVNLRSVGSYSPRTSRRMMTTTATGLDSSIVTSSRTVEYETKRVLRNGKLELVSVPKKNADGSFVYVTEDILTSPANVGHTQSSQTTSSSQNVSSSNQFTSSSMVMESSSSQDRSNMDTSFTQQRQVGDNITFGSPSMQRRELGTTRDESDTRKKVAVTRKVLRNGKFVDITEYVYPTEMQSSESHQSQNYSSTSQSVKEIVDGKVVRDSSDEQRAETHSEGNLKYSSDKGYEGDYKAASKVTDLKDKVPTTRSLTATKKVLRGGQWVEVYDESKDAQNLLEEQKSRSIDDSYTQKVANIRDFQSFDASKTTALDSTFSVSDVSQQRKTDDSSFVQQKHTTEGEISGFKARDHSPTKKPDNRKKVAVTKKVLRNGKFVDVTEYVYEDVSSSSTTQTTHYITETIDGKSITRQVTEEEMKTMQQQQGKFAPTEKTTSYGDIHSQTTHYITETIDGKSVTRQVTAEEMKTMEQKRHEGDRSPYSTRKFGPMGKKPSDDDRSGKVAVKRRVLRNGKFEEITEYVNPEDAPGPLPAAGRKTEEQFPFPREGETSPKKTPEEDRTGKVPVSRKVLRNGKFEEIIEYVFPEDLSKEKFIPAAGKRREDESPFPKDDTSSRKTPEEDRTGKVPVSRKVLRNGKFEDFIEYVFPEDLPKEKFIPAAGKRREDESPFPKDDTSSKKTPEEDRNGKVPVSRKVLRNGKFEDIIEYVYPEDLPKERATPAAGQRREDPSPFPGKNETSPKMTPEEDRTGKVPVARKVLRNGKFEEIIEYVFPEDLPKEKTIQAAGKRIDHEPPFPREDNRSPKKDAKEDRTGKVPVSRKVLRNGKFEEIVEYMYPEDLPKQKPTPTAGKKTEDSKFPKKDETSPKIKPEEDRTGKVPITRKVLRNGKFEDIVEYVYPEDLPKQKPNQAAGKRNEEQSPFPRDDETSPKKKPAEDRTGKVPVTKKVLRNGKFVDVTEYVYPEDLPKEKSTQAAGKKNEVESPFPKEDITSPEKKPEEDRTGKVPVTRKVLRNGKFVDVTEYVYREELQSSETHQITDSRVSRKEDYVSSKFTSDTTDESMDTSTVTKIIEKPIRYKVGSEGTTIETMTGGTVHMEDDVQGMTVVSKTKSSMEQTKDQQLAQAELESLTRSRVVYGVNVDEHLNREGKVKGILEKEISHGVVRMGESGIETIEDVEKSITEIKSAHVSSTLEIDEMIKSTTRSSDHQTYRYEDISESERKRQETKLISDATKRLTTSATAKNISELHEDTVESRTASGKKRVGQALVEESYDESAQFAAWDSKYRLTSQAAQDENRTTTTYLEKFVDDERRPGDLETRFLPMPLRAQPIRHEDNLYPEGKSTDMLVQYLVG